MEGKAYFSEAKVGDKVFDVEFKVGGEIKEIGKDTLYIRLARWDHVIGYNFAGRYRGTADKQTLFYADEVEFVIKPRKKMVKKEIIRYCAVHRESDNNGRNYEIYNLGESAEYIKKNSKGHLDFVGLGRAVIEFEEEE